MILSFIDRINSYIFGPGLCITVFVCGIFLILKLRPFFITKPRRIKAALMSGGTGTMSPVKAMLVALAGTLGVGNIAGVASAIAIGGAGAVFWMLASSVAALPIKYAEIVLAVRHRRYDKKGTAHGGAYFYISDHKTKFAYAMAALFAALCLGASFTMGCAAQANAIAVSLNSTVGIPPIVCGFLLAAVTLSAASGGLKRISFLTSRLIPLMSGIYILMSFFIIFTNLPTAAEVVCDIVREAFDIRAFGGGIVGILTNHALRIGVTRGIVSNEAGCGTAPIAHAGAETGSPAAQGVWGMFEVFIDTAVICTLTALCVLIAEKKGIAPTLDGMSTAIASFGNFIPFADMILCAAVVVFAFCTIICWFFYGTEALGYLRNGKHCGFYQKFYLAAYSVIAVIGSVMPPDAVWSLSDLTISMMSALNITALLLSVKEIKKETEKYFYITK